MKIRLWIYGITFLCMLFTSSSVLAVKYMSIGKAVKNFLPENAKVFKNTKQLDAKQKSRLINDYGWTPDQEKYSFYIGKDTKGTVLGYILIVPEIFNTCFHKYAIGMTPTGEVIETVIVELSCPRAFPVNKKSFLKQFRHKHHTDPLTTNLDIDAVTGATLSSESTAQATRKAVSLHNIFFGGAKPVKVSEATKKARSTAAARIQKAINSKETQAK